MINLTKRRQQQQKQIFLQKSMIDEEEEEQITNTSQESCSQSQLNYQQIQEANAKYHFDDSKNQNLHFSNKYNLSSTQFYSSLETKTSQTDIAHTRHLNYSQPQQFILNDHNSMQIILHYIVIIRKYIYQQRGMDSMMDKSSCVPLMQEKFQIQKQNDKLKCFSHIRFAKDYQEIIKQNLNDDNCRVNVCEPQYFNTHIKLRIQLLPIQGVFSFKTMPIYFIVTKDYPYKPVLVFAEEFIYHPNINNNTKQIYWKILDDREWKPTLTLYFLILQLKFAFIEPDLAFVPNNSESIQCAELFQCNIVEFRRKFEIFYQSNDTSILELEIKNKMKINEIMQENSDLEIATLTFIENTHFKNVNHQKYPFDFSQNIIKDTQVYCNPAQQTNINNHQNFNVSQIVKRDLSNSNYENHINIVFEKNIMKFMTQNMEQQSVNNTISQYSQNDQQILHLNSLQNQCSSQDIKNHTFNYFENKSHHQNVFDNRIPPQQIQNNGGFIHLQVQTNQHTGMQEEENQLTPKLKNNLQTADECSWEEDIYQNSPEPMLNEAYSSQSLNDLNNGYTQSECILSSFLDTTSCEINPKKRRPKNTVQSHYCLYNSFSKQTKLL